MSKKILVMLLALAILLTSCMPTTQTTDQGLEVTSKIDSTLYVLEIKIDDDILSHSEINGSFGGFVAGGYGSMGGRIWQDGKGLLRGELISVTPSVLFAKIGEEIIVKTTDLKIMSLRDQEIVKLVCTADYEPICSKSQEGYLGECYDLWEFDYCRMIDFQSVEN